MHVVVHRSHYIIIVLGLRLVRGRCPAAVGVGGAAGAAVGGEFVLLSEPETRRQGLLAWVSVCLAFGVVDSALSSIVVVGCCLLAAEQELVAE